MGSDVAVRRLKGLLRGAALGVLGRVPLGIGPRKVQRLALRARTRRMRERLSTTPPATPHGLYDLVATARVHRQQGDTVGQRAVLDRAVRIRPRRESVGELVADELLALGDRELVQAYEETLGESRMTLRLVELRHELAIGELRLTDPEAFREAVDDLVGSATPRWPVVRPRALGAAGDGRLRAEELAGAPASRGVAPAPPPRRASGVQGGWADGRGRAGPPLRRARARRPPHGGAARTGRGPAPARRIRLVAPAGRHHPVRPGAPVGALGPLPVAPHPLRR